MHLSTVLRRIRKIEVMRDDPIIDRLLTNMAEKNPPKLRNSEGRGHMTIQYSMFEQTGVHPTRREEARILRRLCETGAFLAVSNDLKKAVVMRQNPSGSQTRTAVADADLVGSIALKDWVRCSKKGRINRYEVTPAGRSALKRMLSEESRKTAAYSGFAEAPSVFSEQHKDWGERQVSEAGEPGPLKLRVNLAESPLTILARKKDKFGKPFLSLELLAAGEQFREDFELAQIGPRVAQNWDRFLTAGDRGNFRGAEGGLSSAQSRFSAALSALGPGLGDIVLRCCCFLEGLERAEKRMGWSARSGKIVLRIALQRLYLHYQGEEAGVRKIG